MMKHCSKTLMIACAVAFVVAAAWLWRSGGGAPLVLVGLMMIGCCVLPTFLFASKAGGRDGSCCATKDGAKGEDRQPGAAGREKEESPNKPCH